MIGSLLATIVHLAVLSAADSALIFVAPDSQEIPAAAWQAAHELLPNQAPLAIDHGPNENSLQQLLQEGRWREGHFDGSGALSLWREVIAAYDNAPHISVKLRTIAAQAAFDRAALLYTQQDLVAADHAARDAVRRFGSTSIDTKLYAPPIRQLFAEAARALKKGAVAEVLVSSDTPGQVYADGLLLGAIAQKQLFSLPVGRYRFYLVTADGKQSRASTVDVASSAAEVAIIYELDQCLDATAQGWVLQCSPKETLWPAIAERLKVNNIIAVQLDSTQPSLLRVYQPLAAAVAASETRFIGIDAHTLGPKAPRLWAIGAAERQPLNVWSFIPWGGSQYAQGRPLAGSLFAGTSAGLLAWHLAALHAQTQSEKSGRYEDEPNLRLQRNVSLGLVCAAAIVSVAEGILVAMLSNDPAFMIQTTDQ